MIKQEMSVQGNKAQDTICNEEMLYELFIMIYIYIYAYIYI